MKRRLLRIAFVLGLVALVVALRITVFAPEPLAVTATEVGRGAVEQTITNTRAGTVKAVRRAQLSPEIGGLVVELPHREGAWVTTGDLLLRLDPRLPTAQADLAERDLRTAEAQRDQTCLSAERAERELQRLSRLAKDRIISEDVLDQAATGAETTAAGCLAARAVAERARSAVRLAKLRVEQTELRAPFDGVIAEVAVEVGEWITPAPPAVPVPPVLDLLDPSSLYVSAPMDEVDASVLVSELEARITVDSMPGRRLEGRVIRVAPYVEDIEEQNRTLEIEARFEGLTASDKILPGTSADVEVLLEIRPDVIRIPTQALIEGGRVLVVRDDLLEEQSIETGLSNWDWTEVVDGLEQGEMVVTSLDRVGVEAGAKVVVE